MRRDWVVAAFLLAGCLERANPRYCNDNSDCNVGTICNLDTHGCVVAADASIPDQIVIDAPRIATTVREVRDPSVPIDTFVELIGVVVVATQANALGPLWVQDEGGGMGATVQIFGGVTSQVDALAIGDVIDVTNARKRRREVNGDITVEPRAGQALGLSSATNTSTLAITDMNLAAFATLSPSELEVELERWTGTFVRVELVRATSDLDAFGSFSIGPLRVSSDFRPISLGTCFVSITGLVSNSSLGVRLFTRSAADVVVGSGCD